MSLRSGLLATVLASACAAPHAARPGAGGPARPAESIEERAGVTPPGPVPEGDASGAPSRIQAGNGVLCTLQGDELTCRDRCNGGRLMTARGITDFSLRSVYVCAAVRNRGVRCWALVGPVRPTTTWDAGEVRAVSVGSRDVCASLTDGHAVCARIRGERIEPWSNWRGPSTDHPPADPPFDDVASIDAGPATYCLARASGEVWCAGNNQFGQVRTPASRRAEHQWKQVAVAHATSVAVSRAFACARLVTGEVTCWGESAFWTGARRVVAPMLIGVDSVQAPVAGDMHMCALGGGRLHCWGSVPGGRSGAPRERTEAPDAVQLAVGRQVTCVLNRSGESDCWGPGARCGEPEIRDGDGGPHEE